MTIQKPIIEELRYVNGQPDPAQRPDQTRINWAKNGESINGASGDTTSDGVLNRAPVEIQENVLNSHHNTKAQQVTIETLVDTVNELTGGEDADLGTRISTNEYDIEVLQTQTTNIIADVGTPSNSDTLATGLHRTTEDIISDVGVRNPQDMPNDVENNDTVRKDLYFIKRRIGNDRNYDVNGNLVPDTVPTGMKYQIDELYNRVATVNQEIGEDSQPSTINGRISELEQNSQAGSVAEIRNELGDSEDAVEGRTVYLRLDDIESAQADIVIDVTSIETTITAPDTGLMSRVQVIEGEQITSNAQLDANTLTISSVSSDIGDYSLGDSYNGSMKARLSTHSDDLSALWTRIGTTDDVTGSIGERVKLLENSLGDTNSPVEFTAWFDIQSNAADILQLQQDLATVTPLATAFVAPETIESRIDTLEGNRAYALLSSETPENISLTTSFQNVADIVDEELELDGYTFVNGAIVRGSGSTQTNMTIAWVLYEPADHEHIVTVRVEVTHPDTTVEIDDYTRKLRGLTVTPIAISHTVNLVEGSEIRVHIVSDSVSDVEHDSLFIRL
ncbi:fibritin neck whisker [Vibrio phage F86]